MEALNNKLKSRTLFVLAALIGGFALSGCQNPFLQLAADSSHHTYSSSGYTVSFNTQGGSAISALSVPPGGKVSEPEPTKAHFILEGWYKDAALSKPWDFDGDTVNSNITLHSKWIFDGIQGDGTPENAFLVYDVPTLMAVGRSGTDKDGNVWTTAACYLQIDNIQWDPNDNWSPLLVPFTGSYDGDGYAISRLYCNPPLPYYLQPVGLFGTLAGASTVKDLSLLDVVVKGGDRIGAIAGWVRDPTASIKNCYVTGSVGGNGIINSKFIGGIAGASSGTVENCYVNCTVKGSRYVGGIAGTIASSKIINCHTTGIVSGDGDVGGIVGESASGVILNCLAENEVIGGGLGGIAGIITYGKVMNCVALNKNLNTPDGGTPVFFRLWVINSNYSPVASNNYARRGMLMDGVPFNDDGDHTGQDGQSIDKGQFNSFAWWTTTAVWADEGWDFTNTWEWDNTRKLPKLKGLGGR